jgi:hypothetical protein
MEPPRKQSIITKTNEPHVKPQKRSLLNHQPEQLDNAKKCQDATAARVSVRHAKWQLPLHRFSSMLLHLSPPLPPNLSAGGQNLVSFPYALENCSCAAGSPCAEPLSFEYTF